MNKKIPLGIAIAIAVISIAVTFAITMTVSQNIYNDIIEDLPQRMEMYDNLAEIDELVHDNYYDALDTDLVNQSIQDGYIGGLGDGYSRYMTSDEYEKYENTLNGKMTGIGADVSFNSSDLKAYVDYVHLNTPAHSNGLEAGDCIVSVDGEAINSKNYKSLFEKLNDSTGTTVTVNYLRDTNEQSVAIPTGYTLKSVESSISEKIGYIKINTFYTSTPKDFSKAVENLTKNEAEALIIDLRGVSGGTIESAMQTADVVVPVASEGTLALATAKNAKGDVIRTFTSDSSTISLPIIILVNDETSGPSELFACNLRDFGKAQLVGETTDGNATMQEIFKLEDGNVLMLTVALVEPYKSESFKDIGLAPDYKVSAAVRGETDLQYDKAVALIKDIVEES